MDFDLKTEWESFKSTHGKTYETMDLEAYRVRVFKSNKDKIDAHNADSTQTFTMKMNKFGDLTEEEFAKMYRNLKVEDKQANQVKMLNVSDLPASVDWNKAGAVTPIKD